MGLNELIDYFVLTRENRMEPLYRQPAEQLTALEILRQVERLERQVAQLTVEGGRWRSLAVTALRTWENNGHMKTIMDEIDRESQR